MSENDKDDVLLEQRLRGHSSRDVARRFRRTPAEVDAAVDNNLPEVDNQFRVRSLKLELERMDRLMRPFLDKALEGDALSGALVVKISERRCALLGIDSPVRIDPVQLTIASQPMLSGTDRVLAALQRLGSNGSAIVDENAPPS